MKIWWTRLRQPHWQMSILFVVVLLSRLPFLDAGYGIPDDAWRVAQVARNYSTTGEYSVSRFPGYPVQEIICSWIWRGGPLALNGASAFLSAVATVAFAASARRLQLRHWWLGGFAFAATPIVFFSSVCAKDYIWALAFALLSMYCALQKRSTIAGLLLGLAVGCRLTSLGLAPAIAIFLAGQTRGRERGYALASFAGATLAASVLVFSPVWLRYGTGFLTFYENFARPDARQILARASVELWGVPGIIGLAIALGAALFRPTSHIWPNKWILGGFGAAVLLEFAAYLRLPHEAAYLLPIVPFVLFFVLAVAPSRIACALCFVLLLAPFIDISPAGLTAGPILRDHTERVQTLVRIRDFLAYSQTLPGRNVIVVGGWQPPIAVLAPKLMYGRIRYAYLMNAEEIVAARQNGERIFYLPAIRAFNYNFNGIDLAACGGIDLHQLFVRQQSEPAG